MTMRLILLTPKLPKTTALDDAGVAQAYLSNPKPGHTTSGLGRRTAGRQGGAGRAGQDADGTIRQGNN